MIEDICNMITEDFLENSWKCVETIVERVTNFQGTLNGTPVTLFRFSKGTKTTITLDRGHFFLRGSVEYANPQVTVEEMQGIVGTRMLEVCGNYFHEYGLHTPDKKDVLEICERLKKPPQGRIVPFLLNTDDTEPDRYSMNPLKESILSTGQSAYPAISVNTENLTVDRQFVSKYEDTLITRNESDLIETQLQHSKGSYIDFIDSVKYAQLETLSEAYGIDLCLHALRMPLTVLQTESKESLLHHIISEAHRDFEAVKQAYDCMGRSIANRTTLLTVPHSKLGYGSKRAARGKIRFSDGKLEGLSINYKTTLLYPNDIDPDDISVAKADDNFEVNSEQLTEYDFHETPSSPQFFLYSLGSPENATLWHGVGAFAAPKLLQSYAKARTACREGRLVKNLRRYGVSLISPTQFNLAPEGMWVHPIHRNIDASIGCIDKIADLVRMGMKIEHLSRFE